MAMDPKRAVDAYFQDIGDLGANPEQIQKNKEKLEKLIKAIMNEIHNNGVVTTVVKTPHGPGSGVGKIT